MGRASLTMQGQRRTSSTIMPASCVRTITSSSFAAATLVADNVLREEPINDMHSAKISQIDVFNVIGTTVVSSQGSNLDVATGEQCAATF